MSESQSMSLIIKPFLTQTPDLIIDYWHSYPQHKYSRKIKYCSCNKRNIWNLHAKYFPTHVNNRTTGTNKKFMTYA